MRTTTPTYILSICLEKESIFSKLRSSHYFQVRWAQITHDWMEQLWKTPDGGKLGSIFTNFFICLIISSPISSFVFNFHTIRPGARLLYQTEPLSGAATLVARLWLYPALCRCVQPESRNSYRKDVVYGLRTMSQKELSAYGRLEVDSETK